MVARKVLGSNPRIFLLIEVEPITPDCTPCPKSPLWAVLPGMGRQLVGHCYPSLFRNIQSSISMRICAGLAGAKLTFLSRLGTTGGTTNFQGLFPLGFHGSIVQRCPAIRCSIVNTAYRAEAWDLLDVIGSSQPEIRPPALRLAGGHR
jgi:hypothetical protein